MSDGGAEAPLDGRMFGPDQPCFGCSPTHPTGLKLTFTRDGDEVVSSFVPTDRHQGPPGILHGGLVMTIADEIAAWAIIATLGKFGFTASHEGRLHRPIRIGRPLEARARVAEDRRRVVTSEVRILQDDALAYSGRFRFVLMDKAGAEKMLERPLPTEWDRFTR